MAQVLDDRDVTNAHVLGWSDGAMVGLYLALRRRDLVSTLVFGGAAFHHDGWLDGVLSDEDPPQFMAASCAEPSPDGANHWEVVVRKAVELHQLEPDLSRARLSEVKAPVLIMVGDDDEVHFSHLLEMYDALPNAELAVVPRSTHGLIIEKPDILAQFARDLHRSDRTHGVAPVRRA